MTTFSHGMIFLGTTDAKFCAGIGPFRLYSGKILQYLLGSITEEHGEFSVVECVGLYSNLSVPW